MSHEITIPRLGWSMEQGTFLGWLKQDGEYIQAGQTLFELENPEVRAAHAAAESHFQTALALKASAAGQLAEEKGRVALYSEILPAQTGSAKKRDV